MSTTTPAAPTTTAPETAADRQIHRAKLLEWERYEKQEQIAKNREYLRLMAANGELTAAQKKWLSTFYADKEKGQTRSEDEVEATRKLKVSAREEIAAEKKAKS